MQASRYRTTGDITAVRLLDDPEKPGTIERFPEGAIIELEGSSPLRSDMVYVIWEGERYEVFAIDLASKAVST